MTLAEFHLAYEDFVFDRWLQTARIMEGLGAVQTILIQINSKAGTRPPVRTWQDYHPLTAKSKPEGLLNPKTMSDILWSIGNQMVSSKGR
jgi:hypothetical protein